MMMVAMMVAATRLALRHTVLMLDEDETDRCSSDDARQKHEHKVLRGLQIAFRMSMMSGMSMGLVMLQPSGLVCSGHGGRQ